MREYLPGFSYELPGDLVVIGQFFLYARCYVSAFAIKSARYKEPTHINVY